MMNRSSMVASSRLYDRSESISNNSRTTDHPYRLIIPTRGSGATRPSQRLEQYKSAFQLLQERRSRASSFPFLVQQPQPPSSLHIESHHHNNGHHQHSSWQSSCLQQQSLSTTEALPSWLQLEEGIHELAGEAGSGKTQIALSLCVDAAALEHPSTSAAAHNNDQEFGSCRAIYISMGSTTKVCKIVERIQQMVEARQQEQQGPRQQFLHTKSSNAETTAAIMNRILTKVVINQDYLMDLVSHELADRLDKEPHVQVIILDSIADLFRTDVATTTHGGGAASSFASRSATLFTLAARLKELSNHYHIPIVVINQVTTTINDSSTSRLLFQQQSSTIPALGLSWAQCVNQSYLLSRHDARHGDANASGNTNNATTLDRRRIRLHRSSQHPTGRIATFRILASGVVLVE